MCVYVISMLHIVFFIVDDLLIVFGFSVQLKSNIDRCDVMHFVIRVNVFEYHKWTIKQTENAKQY